MQRYRRRQAEESDGTASDSTLEMDDPTIAGTSRGGRGGHASFNASGTVTSSTFSRPLGEDQTKASERERKHRMWRKDRQQRKLEDQILQSAAQYRERTYGGDGDGSSDDDGREASPPAVGGGAGAGTDRDGATTSAGSSDDGGTTTSDGKSVGGSSPSRRDRKAMRREVRLKRKESERTRKLTALVLTETNKVQKETIQSIKQTERYVEGANEAGHSAAKSLKIQGEQLHHINEELDNLDPLMERAKRDLAVIARRMAMDKCFLCLCCLVCIALITVIVVAARNEIKGLSKAVGGGASEESVAPTLPTSLPPQLMGFRNF